MREDADPRARYYAADAIGRRKEVDAEAVGALIDALHDDAEFVDEALDPPWDAAGASVAPSPVPVHRGARSALEKVARCAREVVRERLAGESQREREALASLIPRTNDAELLAGALEDDREAVPRASILVALYYSRSHIPEPARVLAAIAGYVRAWESRTPAAHRAHADADKVPIQLVQRCLVEVRPDTRERERLAEWIEKDAAARTQIEDWLVAASERRRHVALVLAVMLGPEGIFHRHVVRMLLLGDDKERAAILGALAQEPADRIDAWLALDARLPRFVETYLRPMLDRLHDSARIHESTWQGLLRSRVVVLLDAARRATT